MKKIILFGIFVMLTAGAAMASDGVYWETETLNTYETFNIDTITYYDDAYIETPRPIVAARAPRTQNCERVASSIDVRPCTARTNAPAPVRVKTHTEVIDHYQVYQPVVQYIPAGTYSERRIIEHPRPCNRCNG